MKREAMHCTLVIGDGIRCGVRGVAVYTDTRKGFPGQYDVPVYRCAGHDKEAQSQMRQCAAAGHPQPYQRQRIKGR